MATNSLRHVAHVAEVAEQPDHIRHVVGVIATAEKAVTRCCEIRFFLLEGAPAGAIGHGNS
jgi:hypothetical protein